MAVSDGVSPSPKWGLEPARPPLNPPLEAEAKCEIRVHFNVFLYNFFDFMNAGAQLGQTNNSKKILVQTTRDQGEQL